MLMIQGEGSAPTGPSGGSGGGGPAPKRLPKSKPKAKGKPSAGGGVTHEQPKKPEDLKAELRDLPLYIYYSFCAPSVVRSFDVLPTLYES